MTRNNIYAEVLAEFTSDFCDDELTDREALGQMLSNAFCPDGDILAKVRKRLVEKVDQSDPGQPPRMPVAKESSTLRKVLEGILFVVGFLMSWLFFGIFSWTVFVTDAVAYTCDHFEYAMENHPIFFVAINILAVFYMVWSFRFTVRHELGYWNRAKINYESEVKEYEEQKQQQEYYQMVLDVFDQKMAVTQ